MASLNQSLVLGNLTRDPEIRYVGSGAAVCKFRLAVNDPFSKKTDGSDTLFIDIVAWEKLAENANTYLKKGGQALVQGKLRIRQYTDKDGVKRQATEIVANNIQFLGGNKAGAPAAAASEVDASAFEEEIPL